MTEQRKCAEIDPLSDLEVRLLEEELRLIETFAHGTEFVCEDIRDITIAELMKRICRENIRGDGREISG